MFDGFHSGSILKHNLIFLHQYLAWHCYDVIKISDLNHGIGLQHELSERIKIITKNV